jgi:hypothetical protein
MVALKDSTVRRGTGNVTSPTGEVSLRIRTRPLPNAVTEFLLKHAESTKSFVERKVRVEEDLTLERISFEKQLTMEKFRSQLDEVLSSEGGEWRGIIDRILTFGPKHIGPNILIDSTENDFRKMYSSNIFQLTQFPPRKLHVGFPRPSLRRLPPNRLPTRHATRPPLRRTNPRNSLLPRITNSYPRRPLRPT